MKSMAIIDRIILVCILCCTLLMEDSDSQSDTLAQGQELKDGMQLFSASGIFRLGFFKPGNASNSYLGIWYNRDDEKAVWVANRNNPILDNSGVLRIDQYGNLKITQKMVDDIVLYSVKEAINASAILLDSGNFVLSELNADGSIKQELWQSFDYPTDTLLPKMKLGFNRKTGLNWTLKSWRTGNLPSIGSFTLGLDPSGVKQMVISWRGNLYWTSGSWHTWCFSLTDEFCSNYKYNFSYISNENETYLSYSVDKGATIFPRLLLNEEGELRGFGMDAMFTGVSCTSSTNSTLKNGCVEQRQPDCRSSHDKFVRKLGVMSRSGIKILENENMTLIDCWDACFKMCSCLAYASANDDGTGCEIWKKGASFTQNNLGSLREIHILESKVKKWWIWLLILVGGTALFPFLCSSCYVLWKKSKSKGTHSMEQNMLLYELGEGRKHQKDGNRNNNELQLFSFDTVATATNCFSSTNKLGEGGFGPVYKGKLLDGKEVAIKRLSRSSGQGLVEFKNEAMLVAKLQHTNLVRLLGFCIQGDEKILIYEYMPNKSLDFFLFDAQRKNVLDWKKRFSIIEGIAQGLIYLHKYSRLKVIHRDLKASNILLDKNLNPKVSDFGMARICGLNESEENTNRVVGTYGYMSPEYAMKGIVSIKTDIFSFGVLLLEIVSGMKNNSNYHSEYQLNLIGYLWNEDRGSELADTGLGESCPITEVLRCIHVGLLCVQDHAADRPTMPDVVSMLLNQSILLPPPKQPAFFINTVEKEFIKASGKESEIYSTNDVTISVMEAR
ncbi:G-type lectin S-receptor-like serine/threonine-protein kinase CES101 isoform X2 [Rosa chinensis]|uniref:G-type lectin S-receptor-like serine/threonine-protein kinase CES101 isoform X2 n=1 Tax=Rosa chinensis TaxID=74649 RepID=UPI000D0952A2|nr:G-type lectin S-receptor-like serine/threonine-protein kinase CES101 isoform X2 [Rosa chinensis]